MPEPSKPVRYRNMRSMIMMLTAVLGTLGFILTAILRWPEWWWLLAGFVWLLVFAGIDGELDKPKRPASDLRPE